MKRIEKEQIVKGIQRANPWWGRLGGGAGNFNLFPKRIHFERLHSLVTQKDPIRALVLMGPRRVGKTVLLYQLIDRLMTDGVPSNKLLYLSLDNPIFRFSELEDLVHWGLEWAGTTEEDAYIFFDEIQYLDTWEQQLKALVDSHRKTKFVVTGSAAAALHKKSKESGAGRFTNYLLPSLSFYEYIFIKGEIEKTASRSIDLLKLNSLYLEYLNYGGFPESVTSSAMRDQPELYIGQDILDKVLGRDLPSAYEISNPNELYRLFAALAFNTSHEISPDNLSKQAGVPKRDINKFLGFLEAAHLIRIVEKTDHALKKFQRVTHFKVVLTNPSLRSAIFGKVSDDSPELEALAETAIYSQLVGPHGTYSPYKYARWNSGNSKGEVDLVNINQKNQALGALEIKWSDRFAAGEDVPRSLISFCKENEISSALMTSKSVFSQRTYGALTVHHFPTSFLCLIIGLVNGALEQVKFTTSELASEGSIKPPEHNLYAERHAKRLADHFFGLSYLNESLVTEFGKSIELITWALFNRTRQLRPRTQTKEELARK